MAGKRNAQKQAAGQAPDGTFHLLFDNHPLPMWIYDLETLAFLDVNDAAIQKYGYTREEFLGLTLKDIRPAQDVPRLLEDIKKMRPAWQFTKEWRHQLKNGQIIDVEITSHTLEFHGRQCALVMAQDVTERKQAEHELRASEARYRDLVENSHDLICIHDLEGNLLSVNNAAVKLTGYPREALLKANLKNFLTEESAVGFDTYLEKIKIEGHAQGRMHVKVANGEVRTWEFRNTLKTDEAQQPIVRGVARDITEQRQAEVALLQNQQRFRALIQNGLDNISLLAVDGTLLWESPSTSSTLGYAPNQYVGRNIFELMHPDDMEWTGKLYEQVVKLPGNSRRGRFRLLGAGGEWHWMEAIATNMLDKEGIEAIVINYRDITERKQTEDELNKSERRYRMLFEDSPVAVTEQDFSELKEYLDSLKEQGITDFRAYFASHPEHVHSCANRIHVRDANQAAVKMYDAEDKDQLIKSMDDPLTEGEQQQIQKVFIAVAEGKTSGGWEGQVETITGRQIEIDLHWSVTPGFERDFSKVIVTTMDVTERKQAEQALQKSETLFKNAFEHSAIGMALVALDGTWLRVNPMLCSTLGYSEAEFLTKTFQDITHPDDLEADLNYVKQALAGEIESYTMEKRYIHKNGHIVWALLAVALVKDADGDPLYFISQIKDITDRKRAEEELRETKNFITTLLELIPASIYVQSTDGKYRLVNHKWEQDTQVDRAEAIGRSIHEVFPLNTARKFEQENRQILESNSLLISEDWHETLNGWRCYHTLKFPLFDTDGHIESIGGISLDITDRKRAEEELQKSEGRYRSIAEDMPAMVCRFKEDGTLTFINSFYCDYFGKPHNELLGSNLFTLIPPSEQSTVREKYLSLNLERPYITYEYRTTDVKGKECWQRWTDRALFNERGEVVEYQSIGEDITERKQAEAQLRLQITMLETSANAIVITDRHGKIEYANPAFAALSGYSIPHEVFGKNPRHLLNSGQQDRNFYENLWNTILAGNAWHGELVNRRKDGTLYNEEMTITPFRNEEGVITHFIAIKQDITERKQVEEALRLSEERFSKAFHSNPTAQVLSTIEDGEIMDANESFLSMFKYERDEVLGRKSLALKFYVNPNQRAELISDLRAKRAVQNREIDFFTQSGEIRHTLLSSELVMIEGREHILSTIIDVTERKQANDAREESERRYRSLFEESPISLWEEDFSAVKRKLDELKLQGVTDFDAYFSDHPEMVKECASLVKILNVNKASVELFHAKDKTDLLTDMGKLLRSDGLSRQFQRELINITNGLTYFEREDVDSTLNGDPIYITTTWAALPGHEDDLSRVIVSIVDMTERKQAEEKIDRLVHELRERVKELTFLQKVDGIFLDYTRPEAIVLQEVADTMPSAWQYPDVTAARVGYNGTQYTTANYKKTDWMQIQFFDLPNGELGFIEIVYLEERPPADEGPFLKEERQLIKMAAEKLQTYLRGKLADRAISRQLAELETLYKSGLAINRLLTPREIAQKIIETLEHNMHWHHIAIREYDPQTKRVRLIGFHQPGISAEEAEEHIKRLNENIINPTKGLSGWVTLNGESLRVSNVLNDERYVGTFPGIRSGVYVPLKLGGQVIGSISVESEMENAFTRNDERLLETLAGQAAIAIQNANLFHQLQTELLERRLIEEEMRQLNLELEQRVQERTLQTESARRRLELATHAGQIGVWEYTPRENRITWDERMYVIHHVREDQFNGTAESWAKLIHPEDIEKSQLNAQLAFTEQLLLNNEHRIVLPNGEIRHIATSSVTVFTEDGTPERVIGICMDITERKQIEQSLRESEAYARLLFDASPDPISVTALDGTMLDINSSFELQHQIQHKELRGRHISELGIFPPEELEKMHDYVMRIAGGETIPPIELRYNFPSDGLHTLEMHSYPIEVGGRQLILSTSRDITERKKLEEALRLANIEMESALKVKDEFLASMSHELRTPLNAILGISESLEEQVIGDLNDKQEKYVHIIKESGRHLLDLINDILDISKIEAGQMELEFHPISVEKLCQSSLRMVKELAQKKSLHVSFRVKENAQVVMGDERRLKQAVVNLLSNAIKFTEEGKRIGLEVTGDTRRRQIHFTIWDTGIGIAEEDIKHLFKPFVQLDSGLAREYQGTGLGLALVAQMIRLHGGNVSVESEPGLGSRFTITLPWNEQEQKATAKVTAELTPPSHPVNEKRRGKILLVEDTDIVVSFLNEYLMYRGYEVLIARNGREGIMMAQQERPDLILMDVMMPIMDGIETTKQIRADASLRDIPIVALTALAMPGDRERCYEAGMTDYMSKPVKMDELSLVIEKYIPQKQEGRNEMG